MKKIMILAVFMISFINIYSQRIDNEKIVYADESNEYLNKYYINGLIELEDGSFIAAIRANYQAINFCKYDKDFNLIWQNELNFPDSIFVDDGILYYENEQIKYIVLEQVDFYSYYSFFSKYTLSLDGDIIDTVKSDFTKDTIVGIPPTITPGYNDFFYANENWDAPTVMVLDSLGNITNRMNCDSLFDVNSLAIHKIVKHNDYLYFTLLEYGEQEYDRNIVIIKTNLQFEILWQKKITGLISNQSLIKNIEILFDSLYSISYTKFNTANKKYESNILILDSDGNTYAEKIFANEKMTMINDIIVDKNNNGYLLIGYTGPTNNDFNRKNYVIKTDKFLNKVWDKAWKPTNNESFTLKYGYHIKDNEYAVFGEIYLQENVTPLKIYTHYRSYFAKVFDETSSAQTIDISENILEIAPNPTNWEVNLSFENPSGIEAEITIFDSKGLEVARTKTNSNFAKLNTNTLGAGIYFAQVELGGKIFTGKFMVVK